MEIQTVKIITNIEIELPSPILHSSLDTDHQLSQNYPLNIMNMPTEIE